LFTAHEKTATARKRPCDNERRSARP
jgi:hypothetical protein